jgi:methylenetetrahydrofolate--tRNA-(uracil-5-)-methyltransferase
VRVTVIGAGLAGTEAVWQLVKRNIPVRLYEMRPNKMTPAHHTGNFGELVCSNSLRGAALENAVGLLKEEMRRLDSLIIKIADLTSVPAGGALAVDRNQFSKVLTDTLTEHPLVEVIREEVSSPPEGPVIIATGPLTSPVLGGFLQGMMGEEYLYFYDAAAPIITNESLDHEKVFPASRYNKGNGEYLNCPFTKEEYELFWNELVAAETAESHLPEERAVFFEGCMPVEVLAKRGIDTLRYGTMKPVGITHPVTGKRPYAVVQLRPEDREGRLYNLVGFQTHLKWGEQKRVFRMIPGMEYAEFVRFGVMHRNTYINAPVILKETLQTKKRADLFFAGQITGVEGYVESAGTGLIAGINCARMVSGQEPMVFPAETALGALTNYITHADPNYFQPMNINFGLFPGLNEKHKGKQLRHLKMAERSLQILAELSID